MMDLVFLSQGSCEMDVDDGTRFHDKLDTKVCVDISSFFVK